MNPTCPLFYPLSLFLFFSLLTTTTFHIATAGTNSNLIHETCKDSTQTDPNVNYNFCVTSLQAAPDSICAASRDRIGMISIRLLRYNTTNTRCYIKKVLLEKNRLILDPYVKQCLMDCFDVYSDAVDTLKEAMQAYDDKQYVGANFKVSAAMDAPTTCEQCFMEKKGVVSPLTKRNNDAFQLSAIALSIINMLH